MLRDDDGVRSATAFRNATSGLVYAPDDPALLDDVEEVALKNDSAFFDVLRALYVGLLLSLVGWYAGQWEETEVRSETALAQQYNLHTELATLLAMAGDRTRRAAHAAAARINAALLRDDGDVQTFSTAFDATQTALVKALANDDTLNKRWRNGEPLDQLQRVFDAAERLRQAAYINGNDGVVQLAVVLGVLVVGIEPVFDMFHLFSSTDTPWDGARIGFGAVLAALHALLATLTVRRNNFVRHQRAAFDAAWEASQHAQHVPMRAADLRTAHPDTTWEDSVDAY